jgi:prolyl oligopeptidase
MTGYFRSWISAALVFFTTPLLSYSQSGLPDTPQRPIVDVYHGVKVADPYRWLEDRKDAAVRQWVDKQNRFTRAYLDNLPQRRAILDRLRRLGKSDTVPYDKLTFQDGKLFAQSGELLVTLKSADTPESERTLVDAERVVRKQTAVIDFYNVSPNAKTVAVSISYDGKEIGSVYLFDVASGRRLKDIVPNVKSPLGGSLAWKGDNRGFYYTRNPERGKTNPAHQLIYYHALGQNPADDDYVFGKDLSPIADNTLDVSGDDKFLLVSSSTGWAAEQNNYYLIELAGGKVRQLGKAADKISNVRFGGADDELLFICNLDTPRGCVRRVGVRDLDLKNAKTLVPQLEGVVQNVFPVDKRLLVVERFNGSTRLRLFDRNGKELQGVPVPSGFHVSEVVSLESDEILFLTESYFTPPSWYHCKLGTDKARKTKLFTTYPNIDYKDSEVVRELVVSKDGTKVPLTILRQKKIKLDGTNPVLLYGYGGYNLIQNPEFEASRRLWLEQGGVYAVAHLRGDGDFGEVWHRGGILTKRQNAFDDFAACARHLITRKYTTSDKLAIEGASNGGTLMGAALTQNPQLFRAVVSQVGVYDMLRHELRSRGFDVPEFGSVKDPEQFKAMYAYSPYHRVVDGTNYPAILLATGANDGRVDPTDSWKFAARLQASGSKRPILLWTAADAGHQLNASEATSSKADIYAFLFEQLGMKFKQR